MSVYLHSYTRALKNYDPDLFAGRTKDGIACVFRRSKRLEPVCELNGVPLLVVIRDYQLVFPITDNWTMRGIPRDWGIDDVVQKVQQSDALANERFFEDMDEANEKIDRTRSKDLKNQMESFWIDERRSFAKATDDILTHSLSKDEPRKRLKDRSIKNGNN